MNFPKAYLRIVKNNDASAAVKVSTLQRCQCSRNIAHVARPRLQRGRIPELRWASCSAEVLFEIPLTKIILRRDRLKVDLPAVVVNIHETMKSRYMESGLDTHAHWATRRFRWKEEGAQCPILSYQKGTFH